MMDEILKALAAHTGVSVETAKTALGAVMTFLEGHLPAGLADQLKKSLPDAQGLAAAYEANKSVGGEALMAAISGLAGKVLGHAGGEATKLVGMLHESGLDPKQIESFLPKAIELIRAHVPPELIEKVVALFPALGAAAGKH